MDIKEFMIIGISSFKEICCKEKQRIEVVSGEDYEVKGEILEILNYMSYN